MIEKRLLPSFPNFAIKGKLMFNQPLGDTLRGFYFEPSAFSKRDFYVYVFFMPLFVPKKHIHFTFGHRVNRKEGWSSGQADLEDALTSELQKELPFLISLSTARDVARALEPLTRPNESGYVNPHCYEALAYTLLKAGEGPAALGVMNTLLKHTNPAVAWEREVASRVQLVKDKLLGNAEEATKQLGAWEDETIHNLGIESFSIDHRAG